MGADGVKAMEISVANDCGWGYMNNNQNQHIPFRFEGVLDDTLVYNAFIRVIR